MSLNGSGSYSAPAADFPAVANTLIESTKFNNIINDIATALSTAVYKDGQQTVTANIPMGGFRFTGLGAGSTAGHSLRYEQLFTTSAVTLLGALDLVKGADIASAGTLNLTTATGNGVHVTGTTTITAVTLGSGMWRLVVFDGALTLTHHATNNNLPGGANITTAAGDRALYWADGATVYCAIYMPANAAPIAPYVDTNPVVRGSADATKLLRFEVDGFTTATTRVLTAPNFDGTIATLAGTEALTNKDISSTTNTYRAASDTATGAIEVAIQSEMESGSSTTLAVTPGRQQYHPSAAKVWGQASASGTLIVGYNVTSITDTGTGVATVVVGTDFSTDNVAVSDVVSAVGTLFSKINGTPTTSSFAIIATTAAGTPTDPDRYMFCAFGDQ